MSFTDNNKNENKGEAAKSSVVSAPSISLPKGGGAIRGIGEKFAANPVTGTGSFSVPIAATPGRSGFSPQLSLSYDSGSGNGPFGFGWSLSLPAITRKTDKGLPKYEDADESDVFILSGAEDLVPVLEYDEGVWKPPPPDPGNVDFIVKRYRPRTEGLFARIEKWTDKNNGDIHWRSISNDNITTIYGKDAQSRIFDPNDPLRIFSWLICESFDDKGNAIIYEYVPEDSAGIDLSRVHEKNRTNHSRKANRYIKRIKYGNRTPNRDENWKAIDPTLLSEWMFEVVFDYDEGHYLEQGTEPGTHRYVQAVKDKTTDWPVRQDPFSTCRPGFEVRTYRLCRRVLMFHHFPDELGQDDYLVRSTEFTYNQSPIASFITSVNQSGYVLTEGGYLKKSLPPLEFLYSQAEIQEEVRCVDAQSLENLPNGLDGSTYQWVDLNGEGLSGILTEQADAWFYKPNRGNGQFAPLQAVAVMPSMANLTGGQQQLLDLAGDGQLDLVQFREPLPGFYERTDDEQWKEFTPFESCPYIDWNDPNLKFIDLTGDGHADILVSEDHVFTWHLSLAEQGFAPSEQVQKIIDEEKGPGVIFADGTQSIYLADLSGDGLSDIVRIRNGEVCCWPNLGYGRFGSKVTMDNSPWFDNPDQFDQRRLHLADIDGSGTTDIIYFGHEKVSLYFNQSGNSWSDAQYLTQFPHTDNLTSVTVNDLLGNGTACIVWSSPLPGDREQPMRYIDLMGGQKPHLLIMVKNNMGAETRVEYTASTKFYLQDREDGNPWITRLPFPVHVVERVETYDRISKNRFVTRYSYHHGYFDGKEREFRGFGMVEQWDTEEIGTILADENYSNDENLDEASFVPPVFTRTWFHTGAYIKGEKISRQFEKEYYREPGLTNEQVEAVLLPDTVLPINVTLPDSTTQPCDLTSEEIREACRALRGSILRQEVYAQDGSEKSEFPYTVSERSYEIKWLQPKENNQHAVFFVHPSETINYHYERNPDDSRTSHELTLEADAFGNVLKSAAIGYGRRQPDPALEVLDQLKQTQMLMTYTENKFTNIIDQEDAFRTPLPCETLTYEITGLELGSKIRFSCEDMLSAGTSAPEIHYEETAGNTKQKRPIEHVRTLYRKDDLSGALSLEKLEPMALPYESYKLAFTPGLLKGIFIDTGKISAADLADVLTGDCAYVDLDRDGHWWIPSGQVFYSPEGEVELAFAREHFFLPHRFRDPFGNIITVDYDSNDLLVSQTIDPLDNIVTAENDYRMMQPEIMTDPNGNRSAVAFDASGMVVGTAVMGKDLPQKQGDSLEDFEPDLDDNSIQAHTRDPLNNPHDILNRATTRLVYDLTRYRRTSSSENPQPNVVCTLARETHDADLEEEVPQTKIQHSFLYSDGFGREIQTKVQAEPGDAPLRQDNSADPDRPGALILEDGKPKTGSAARRWVGTGRTIYNNKGKTVKKYEPFFSSTHLFETEPEVAETGVTPIIFYDPLERVIATLHPNHTYEKVVFDPWRQETWDVNDTVLQDDPGNDEDVGDFFQRLRDEEYLPTWHGARKNGQLGAAEKSAADKTKAHANTPSVAYLDTLSRTFLSIADNGLNKDSKEQKYETRVELDIEGNQREIIDARGNKVMQYDYDMLSSSIHQNSMDAGERWMLNNAAGNPVKRWDGRDHRFTYSYDELQRPTLMHVKGGDGDTPLDNVFEKIVYGDWKGMSDAQRIESKNNNLIGQPKAHYDTAGRIEFHDYDFKGNLKRSTRRLAGDYKNVADWKGADLDAGLEIEPFHTETEYDALNRVTQSKTPDESITKPTYNQANLLEKIDVNLRGVESNGNPVWTPFIKNINYNAKGQREKIEYIIKDNNNDCKVVNTDYTYDPLTYRLTDLITTRTTDGKDLQVLHYTYDPMGNITSIKDNAQQVIYFNNQVVSPHADYLYDPLYRLIGADGREHIGQVENPRPTHDDKPRMNHPHPGDGQAMRRYVETYEYDGVGNILKVVHKLGSLLNPGQTLWKRRYQYAIDSNRLLSTCQPNDADTPEYSTTPGYSDRYKHDSHGNMNNMPYLEEMEWDFKDRLHVTQRQVVNNGSSAERTYYVYDASGQRVRKITVRQTGTRKEECIYIGGFEFYREYKSNGNDKNLERETLHVMDDKQRIALLETKTVTNGNSVASPLIKTRYQFGNHLGTAVLELDYNGEIISYEEYTPFGSTSYQAVRSQTETPKRYRYTGKERDEESGLYYHGARYYAPWLGRWISPDRAGLVDGVDLYPYVRNNPIRLEDPQGFQSIERVTSPYDPNDPLNYVSFESFREGAVGPWSEEGLRMVWENTHPHPTTEPISYTHFILAGEDTPGGGNPKWINSLLNESTVERFPNRVTAGDKIVVIVPTNITDNDKKKIEESLNEFYLQFKSERSPESGIKSEIKKVGEKDIAKTINEYSNIKTLFYFGHGSESRPDFGSGRFPNASEFDKTKFEPEAVALWAGCNSWKYAQKFTESTGVTSLGVEGTTYYGSKARGISAGIHPSSTVPGSSRLWIFTNDKGRTKNSGPYRININRGIPFLMPIQKSLTRDPFEPPWPYIYTLSPAHR